MNRKPLPNEKPDRNAWLLELHNAGMSYRDIAATAGISSARAHAIVQIQIKKGGSHEQSNPNRQPSLRTTSS